MGYASNHADIDHWWLKYHGYSIDDFRQELKNKLECNDMEKYNTIEDVPLWAKSTIEKLINKKYLKGNGTSLDLSIDMIRVFVINDKAGLYN